MLQILDGAGVHPAAHLAGQVGSLGHGGRGIDRTSLLDINHGTCESEKIDDKEWALLHEKLAAVRGVLQW